MRPLVLACAENENAQDRPLAECAYDEARARGWPFLSDVLEGVLREAGEEDRAVVTAVVQALVRYDRLLGFACGSSSSSSRFAALPPLVRGETTREPRLARIENENERLGTEHSFPDWIVDLVRGELGDEALARALLRMNEPAPRVARVNTLKTTRNACANALATEGI